LLRDYAYNVDPDALIMHQHKFIQGNGYESVQKRVKEYSHKSVLCEKLNELNSKLTRRSTIYEDDRVLIGDIQSEAAYVEA
jgi:hypothetical protein